MKTISEAEFTKRYGESAVSFFKQDDPAPRFFNFEAAKDVFVQAGEDFALASSDNPLNPADGSLTLAIQGGLSVPRAIGAGLFGTETGQNVSEATVKGLTELGEFITPDQVQEAVGEIARKTIEGYQGMTPEEQLKQRNRLGVAEVLSYFVAGNTVKNVAKNTGVPNVPKPDLTKASDEVVTQAKNLRENVQSYVGSKTVDDQVTASATRLIEEPVPDNFLAGTARRTSEIVDVYDDYLRSAESAINDIKLDPPISTVGGRIGNAFDGVIKQRRVVGKALGDELDEVGKLRVSVDKAAQDLLGELADSGLSFNPRTRQFTSFQGTKFTAEEIAQLTEFFSRMSLLGRSPTVKSLDNFISQTRSKLAFTKGATGVHAVTNAERIINSGLAGLRNSIDPDVNGIQQLARYWDANKTYSQLSDFIEEGGKYLGRITQSGDYAKDASIAKSSVQSILNNGKKDWLLKLEQLSGYNALDDSVLALQAMKDAGDFRGLSLLQKVRDGGLPTSKAGVTGAIIDKTFEAGAKVVAGSPSAQTRAYLKTLTKDVKKNPTTKKAPSKTPDKAVKAQKDVPKTKKIEKLEKQIDQNVKAQKKAAKAKDFTLLAKLKDAYQKLVAALKKEIKWVKENMDSEAGFINLFGAKDGPKRYKKHKESNQLKKFRREEEEIWEERGFKTDSKGRLTKKR